MYVRVTRVSQMVQHFSLTSSSVRSQILIEFTDKRDEVRAKYLTHLAKSHTGQSSQLFLKYHHRDGQFLPTVARSAINLPVIPSRYDFEVLRSLRGRPTLRSLTASRFFGSISHTFPTFMAFKRPLPIIARILLGDTFKRLAASVVLMIFMAQSIAFCENCAVAQ